MKLSETGKIVETDWLKTGAIRPDMNLEFGAFVVMPDHFHGIIIIGENEYNKNGWVLGRDAMDRVPTKNTPPNKFGSQTKNLASIVRGFKSSVTTNARKFNPDFAWQPRFHDHIIRNGAEFERIANYKENNPPNWIKDKFIE